MKKSLIELVVGNLDEKRSYKRFVKRINALPKEYRFAFKKMQNYLYCTDTSGCDGTLFTDLLELFEASTAQNKPILDVIGDDAAAFCDKLIRASSPNALTPKDKLNKEILEHFNKEEN